MLTILGWDHYAACEECGRRIRVPFGNSWYIEDSHCRCGSLNRKEVETAKLVWTPTWRNPFKAKWIVKE